MTDEPGAYVDEHGVLHDDDALGMVVAVERHNCLLTLRETDLRERVLHFAKRMAALGRSPRDTVIVILNVDDVHGGPTAERLMPGHDWSEIRARGETPYARGLAERAGFQVLFDSFDRADVGLGDLADKLREAMAAIIVMDRGVIAVFTLAEVVLP